MAATSKRVPMSSVDKAWFEMDSSTTLMIINVDDFKEINAIFGYRIGDSVLVFLARIFSHILPDFVEGVYKLAGDEFAVLIDMSKRQ